MRWLISNTKSGLFLMLISALLLVSTQVTARPRAKQSIRIQALVLRNNDDTEPAAIAASELMLWLHTANQTLNDSGAAIQLVFDPQRDWASLRSSALNDLHNYRPACLPLFKQAQTLAKKYPHKLLVVFRHGRKERPTGNGFSIRPASGQPGLIVMPGFSVTTIQRVPGGPRLQNRKLFVHELGHFLGLEHTFPGNGSKAPKDLAALKKWAQARTDYDGDGLKDTPADPLMHLWFRYLKQPICQPSEFDKMAGIDVLRHNPMSYLNCTPYRFTRDQVQVLEQTLASQTYRYLLGLDSK